jgi:hypothetical protein
MRHYVDRRIFPANQFSFMPNLVGFLQSHEDS